MIYMKFKFLYGLSNKRLTRDTKELPHIGEKHMPFLKKLNSKKKNSCFVKFRIIHMLYKYSAAYHTQMNLL